jgi:hypothetical protein
VGGARVFFRARGFYDELRRSGSYEIKNRQTLDPVIYTHVLNRGGKGVHSPADQLGIDLGRL